MHGKQGEELSSLLLPGICSHWEGLFWWNTKLQPLQPLHLQAGLWLVLYTAWRVDLVHLLGSSLPWLFTRNAAEELVWVACLPALLSAEGQHLSAVLSQVVYPQFESKDMWDAAGCAHQCLLVAWPGRCLIPLGSLTCCLLYP